MVSATSCRHFSPRGSCSVVALDATRLTGVGLQLFAAVDLISLACGQPGGQLRVRFLEGVGRALSLHAI